MLCTNSLFAAEPTLMILVDPEDNELAEDLGVEAKVADSEEELEDAVPYRLPRTRKQERIEERLFRQQLRLQSVLQEFLSTEFDPQDDEAFPRFVQAREEIVDLVFSAETERAYYERLYIVNQTWLDNMDKVERFESLDRALINTWQDTEERRKQIREIIVGASALAGGLGIGYFTFKKAQKWLPVSATDKALSVILKWLGRAPIIVFGAGVGAAAGAYVGFLASDYLVYRQYLYTNPIEGDEDLVELLDIVEQLP